MKSKILILAFIFVGLARGQDSDTSKFQQEMWNFEFYEGDTMLLIYTSDSRIVQRPWISRMDAVRDYPHERGSIFTTTEHNHFLLDDSGNFIFFSIADSVEIFKPGFQIGSSVTDFIGLFNGLNLKTVATITHVSIVTSNMSISEFAAPISLAFEKNKLISIEWSKSGAR